MPRVRNPGHTRVEPTPAIRLDQAFIRKLESAGALQVNRRQIRWLRSVLLTFVERDDENADAPMLGDVLTIVETFGASAHDLLGTSTRLHSGERDYAYALLKLKMAFGRGWHDAIPTVRALASSSSAVIRELRQQSRRGPSEDVPLRELTYELGKIYCDAAGLGITWGTSNANPTSPSIRFVAAALSHTALTPAFNRRRLQNLPARIRDDLKKLAEVGKLPRKK